VNSGALDRHVADPRSGRVAWDSRHKLGTRHAKSTVPTMHATPPDHTEIWGPASAATAPDSPSPTRFPAIAAA